MDSGWWVQGQPGCLLAIRDPVDAWKRLFDGVTMGNVPQKNASWGVIAMLAAAQFVMILDSTVMNVSITTIVKELNTTVLGLQTAITVYTLVMAAFMLIGGKFGERWGRNVRSWSACSCTGPARSRPRSRPTWRCCSSAGRLSRASAPYSSSPRSPR